MPARTLLPLAQGIARVFARLGEKKNRARARMKFLVANLGVDEFRKLVEEELAKLPPDPEQEALYKEAFDRVEKPVYPGSTLDLEGSDLSDTFRVWYRKNVSAQRQEGYSIATIFLPLGDLTADQLRGVGQMSRKFVKDSVRTTVGQNLILRWVPNGDLPAVHAELERLQLALPIGNSVADITACPGTDSCKLGIASSRGLAGVLHRQLIENVTSGNGTSAGNGGLGMSDGDGGLRDDISIKISGCFNSCGQHHVASIGFFGTSKRKSGRVAPLFQVLLGGTTDNNADSYGLAVAKVVAHRAPEVVSRLTALYDSEKQNGEAFKACMDRLGKARIKEELAGMDEFGEEEAAYYDNRQPWQYIKDVGAGECAGAVVDQAEFMLDDAERLIFEASLHLEAGRTKEAADVSFKGMKASADALLSTHGLLLSDKYDTGSEFRTHFLDTGNFFPGVADYFAKAEGEGDNDVTTERSRQRVEEANLFIEEAHVVYSRMAGSQVK
jgi:sulfite reductase (ferredoxin)